MTDGGSLVAYIVLLIRRTLAGLRCGLCADPLIIWDFDNNYWAEAGAADQLYSFLKAVYDEVQRPIWVTEFNKGANWTDDAE